jgi:hypothetical protein
MHSAFTMLAVTVAAIAAIVGWTNNGNGTNPNNFLMPQP